MSTTPKTPPADGLSDEERKEAARAEVQRMIAAQKEELHRPPLWWGILTGLLAAGAGLAVGEFVAGFSRVMRSPVVSVGDRIIDRVPKGVREWAIRTFETSDKTVLVWSIVIVVFAVAAVVGVVTVRGRTDIGLGFAASFGFLGAWAGGVGRNTRFIGVFPAIAAALVAGAVLMLGYRLAHPKPPKRAVPTARPAGAPPVSPALDRRHFLTISGGIALGSVIVASMGKSLQGRFNASLERAGVRPPIPEQPLPAPPADPAALAANDGLTPLITPIAEFYRIDTALIFPSVALESWRLKVTGMVNQELSLTYDDLSARELIERDITISCVSNEVGGGLIGNARWVGCRLDDLLAEAGIRSEADQVMGISVDGFTAGFPVETLDGRDAMIAIGMNGDVLPVKNGFPARIIVPGIYGYVSTVKWLSEIKLTRFADELGYWVQHGWAALAPVKTESRIDRPRGRTPAGSTHIAGVAWAPHRGIAKVEVQVDDGEWMKATLGPSLSDDTWRQWWVEWNAPTGEHQIRVRATDGTGETQTEERARPDPDGATGWHTIRVDVA